MWTAIRNPEELERKIVKVYETEEKLKNDYIVVISRVLGDLFVFCFNVKRIFITHFCHNFFFQKNMIVIISPIS